MNGQAQPRNEAWKIFHQGLNFLVRREQPRLLFIGDSITAGWLLEGRTIWQRVYGPLRVSSLGIPGDRTEHVSWRIDHGALEGIAPKVTVVLIGTNNIDSPAQDIAQGIRAVVGRIKDHLPKTQILVLSLFPREKDPDSPYRQKIAATNALLSQISWGPGITYLDFSDAFLGPGEIISTEVMRDFLHLTAKGYAIWEKEMSSTLKALLDT